MEPCDGGDVYMQIARDFQLYVSHLRENSEKKDLILKDGAPIFLLCISGMLQYASFTLYTPYLPIFRTLKGSTLTMAGGFYDGESHIVEALA